MRRFQPRMYRIYALKIPCNIYFTLWSPVSTFAELFYDVEKVDWSVELKYSNISMWLFEILINSDWSVLYTGPLQKTTNTSFTHVMNLWCILCYIIYLILVEERQDLLFLCISTNKATLRVHTGTRTEGLFQGNDICPNTRIRRTQTKRWDNSVSLVCSGN